MQSHGEDDIFYGQFEIKNKSVFSDKYLKQIFTIRGGKNIHQYQDSGNMCWGQGVKNHLGLFS